MADKLTQLANVLSAMIKEPGFSCSQFNGVGVFSCDHQASKTPTFYQPFVCLVAQGEKRCEVGDESFYYERGDFFINFLPLPVTTQVLNATKEKPFLSASAAIDPVRLADMALKIERSEHNVVELQQASSCVMIGHADESLVDVFYRLMTISNNPLESEILGQKTLDEMYYRLLISEQGTALRNLLKQHGQVQPIAKAVDYIHQNLTENIQVQQLAELSNMSKSAFFNAFKNLMHMPPLQYIKSTRLQQAQTMLRQGVQATAASYQVGYNSFSQFSREYKRLFGYSPSQTSVA